MIFQVHHPTIVRLLEHDLINAHVFLFALALHLVCGASPLNSHASTLIPDLVFLALPLISSLFLPFIFHSLSNYTKRIVP